MKPLRGFFPAICLVVLAAYGSAANASTTIAFGFLNNKSDNRNYDYLETIFPNSFASSIRSVFRVEIKKPLQIEEELKRHNLVLKKHYDYSELPEIADRIGADIFIFGNFRPLPANQVRIELHLFARESGEVFTFTNTGKMETEIFRLVDRISLIVINFLGRENLYKRRAVAPGARIALLSNVDGTEFNTLCAAFMDKSYPVTALRSDDLEFAFDPERFETFRYIRTKNCSYDIITDIRPVRFYRASWTGKKYVAWTDSVKAAYTKYDLNYTDIKNSTLERLRKSLGGNIDVLLIIGFSPDRKNCWLRAIDVKEKELIWMWSNLEAAALGGDRIRQMGEKISGAMQEEVKNPFEK